MWATTTTLSCKLWSPATVTVTGNRSPFTVSARNTRPRKNINYDHEYEIEDKEIIIEQELEPLNQQEETIGESDGFKSCSPEISGSAVLLALQKASAQKTSKKISKKKSSYVKEIRSQGNVVADYSHVKPLCIKSDWKDRLDELESQLNDLIHTT